MIQLNWYKIFGESHQIPDGRTVTPTDDIQIWLHCADIWDKTYTTLAEVLADTSTLVMLMATDNAVDYLVRSTTWAVAVTVPAMTGYTTPSGEVIESRHEGSYYTWKAFDGSTSDYFAINPASVGDYYGYKFTSAQKITKLYAYLFCGVVNTIGLVFEGSNNGIDYTEVKDLGSISIDILTSDYGGQYYKEVETTFANDIAYTYYRLRITSITVTSIASPKTQFYSASITNSEIAMKSIGASDYASTTLLADSTWLTAIDSSAYKDYVIDASVPKMTSNTTPSGVVSDEASSASAYTAFDNDATTRYIITGNVPSHWIQYQFDSPIMVRKVGIQAWASDPQGGYWYVPKKIQIQGSVDGVTFVSLQSFDVSKVSASQLFQISPASESDTYYPIVRYVLTPRNEDPGQLGNTQLGSLFIYGRQIGGVQTWLRSANITDKTYTTLSEVLADSTTLSALMSNHNAVDYLVTAKGWADDICADSTAMTYIGLNNYASNTLLADSTWCNAICNSTYFESVLNVKVPTLTTNTSCYSSAVMNNDESNYGMWRAFDGDNSLGSSFRCESLPCWGVYDFGHTVKVHKIDFLNASDGSYSKDSTITIVGSDDLGVNRTNYDTISDIPKGIVSTYNVNSASNSHRCWGIASSTTNNTAGTPSFRCATLQMYGREDV